MKLFRSKRNGIVGVVFPSQWLDGAGFVYGHNQTPRTLNILSAASRRLRRSTFVSAASDLLVFLSLAVAVEVRAADQGVNLQYSRSAASIESPAAEPTVFWERFKVAFDQSADERFADDFRPFSALNWSLRLADRDTQQIRERIPDAARQALSRSVVDSLREGALEFPIMLWLKEHEGFFTGLLLNSLGNVQEEAVSPLDPSYRVVERSWWGRLSTDRSVNYGFRPFRTNPYAFLSKGFNDGDQVVVLANARYYYRSFADHRFELALSVPLAHGFAFDVGTLYQFGQHDEEKGLVLKLLKQLNHGGVVHVGFEMKQRPVLFAGITVPL